VESSNLYRLSSRYAQFYQTLYEYSTIKDLAEE
jgi:hypothetical protein